MADLAVIVPSRARPQNIARLMEAMDQTCRADTELVVAVDDDDPTLEDYLTLNANLTVGPSRRLVAWLNKLAPAAAEESRFIGHIGDDNIPRTEGWDERIIESLEAQGDIGFCFGDDLDPGRVPGSLSIHIFLTAEVIKRLGYMGPPILQHMYVDPVWFAWGTATSIEFLPDVVLEHMHYTISGKGTQDDSYAASTGLIPSDCGNYNAYCADGMNADIEKLGGTPFTPEAMAEFNRSLNIPAVWG
ncbi:MAG TPA: hypothetical protein VM493_08140 [Vicinamibacterales bacterium]|nr:hypothetical protein [Vicinamibacterales bacterium]